MKLRSVLETDFAPLIRLMTDPVVRKYLGGVLAKESAIERAQQYLAKDFNSLKVIEVDEEFAGLVTLSEHCEEPGTEISYQLLPEYTGKGYAFSALESVLQAGEGRFVAETQAANFRSRKLLKKLGFSESRTCERYGELQVIAVRSS